MDNSKGMFVFSGMIESLETLKTEAKKWRTLKAVFDYATKGITPNEEFDRNGIFLMIKSVIDAGNKKQEKEASEDEKENVVNSKTNSKNAAARTQAVSKVCSAVPSKKVTQSGIKNINKNKKEIEKEITKEKEQEKIALFSSSSKKESEKKEEEEEKDINCFSALTEPPEFEESIDVYAKNIEDAYIVGEGGKGIPTLEEIREFVDLAGLTVQPETFFTYYKAKKWLVNGKKMKDWRACVLKWNKKELEISKALTASKKSPSKPKTVLYRGEQYTIDEFDKMFFDDLDKIDL